MAIGNSRFGEKRGEVVLGKALLARYRLCPDIDDEFHARVMQRPQEGSRLGAGITHGVERVRHPGQNNTAAWDRVAWRLRYESAGDKSLSLCAVGT